MADNGSSDTYEEECNTCGGTGRWESTTEDEPETLIDLGPCPDCLPE